MRLLIISDTHGQFDQHMISLAEQADIVVHAGDVGGGCILETLSRVAPQLIAVRGNNDTPKHWGNEHLGALKALPQEARLDLPGGELVVLHGDRVKPAAKRHQRLRERYPNARLVVYGHSHRLLVDQDQLPWIANPGAAGRTRTFGGPSCLLLQANDEHWDLHACRFPLGKN
jgi:putative phosphoesterase